MPFTSVLVHKRQPEDRHLSPTIHNPPSPTPHPQISSEVTEEEQVLEWTAHVSLLGSYFKFSLQVCLAQHLLGMKEGAAKDYHYCHDISAGPRMEEMDQG